MSTPEEDEAWRTIVENYGDRPQFPEASARPEAARRPEPRPTADEEHPELREDPADHFVPQEAPPVPLPRGRRAVAWFGVFGVPALVLLGIVLGIHVSGWLALLLFCWFAGGFIYLVATMRNEPTDGWDDGAVV